MGNIYLEHFCIEKSTRKIKYRKLIFANLGILQKIILAQLIPSNLH